MNFPKITIWYGSLMIGLGIIGYLSSGRASLTALIPAAFGVVFLALGLLARNESRRKTAMHIAAGLAVIAFIGSVRGIGSLVTVFEGGEIERIGAAVSQAVMAVLSLGFIFLAVISFVAARRSSSRGPAGPAL